MRTHLLVAALLCAAVSAHGETVMYACSQRAQAWSYATSLRNAGVPWRRGLYLELHRDTGGYTSAQIKRLIHAVYFAPELAPVSSRFIFRTVLNSCLNSPGKWGVR